MPRNQTTTLLAWAVRLLAAAGAGLSAYLLYASVTAAPVVGCGWSSFDCDSALASHWSKWFGVPVAAGGLAVYGTVFAASLLITSRSSGASSIAWKALEIALPLAVGSAAWFVGVQAFALDSFCLYCMLNHACGVAILVLVIVLRSSLTDDEPAAPLIGAVGLGGDAAPIATTRASGPPRLGLATVLGCVGVVTLVAGQLLGPAPAPETVAIEASSLVDILSFDDSEEPSSAKRSAPPTTPVRDAVKTTALKPIEPERAKPSSLGPPRKAGGKRTAQLLNGAFTVDTYAHPMLGSPEAEHIVVELMDYACPHCREFHELVTEALERFEGRVGVVVMPVPGELLCNPYVKKARPKSRGACKIAKVSLAAAMLAPEAFPEMHHWLLRGDRLPAYTSALIEAQKHADSEKLSQAVRDESGEIATRIEQYVGLMASFHRVGNKVGLPTQIFPNRLVSGPPKTIDELCDLWASEFGIDRPVDDTPLPF